MVEAVLTLEPLQRLFSHSTGETHDLDTERNYIFGVHPHGCLCINTSANLLTNDTCFGQTFPGITSHVCTLKGQFWFPLRREILLAFGLIECSQESIQWQLSRPEKGRALVIVVGGVAEMFYAKPNCYDLVLEKRKGFVKMALKYGADLVPVYCFGENDLYDQIHAPEGSWLRQAQELMKQLIGFHIPVAYGTYIALPHRRPINTVVGKPITVEQCDEPDEKQVDALHARYVTELIELFEEHKTKYGVPLDKHLTIH